MGKRGAVRNNSGLPVDHSGPGLRVRPTTSLTADRKSEACPPDFLFSVSQHKSGRESESGALSGASVASGGLRSAATQRGSSLDQVQINRNKTYESVYCTPSVGRGKHCGKVTVGCKLADGTRRYIRVDCRCWGCGYCGPKKAARYRHAIRECAERHKLNRFLTLTLDPKVLGEAAPVAYINAIFAKWRIYLKRNFHVAITYIRILEFQKNGNSSFSHSRRPVHSTGVD